MNCPTVGVDRMFTAFQPTVTEPDPGFGIWQHRNGIWPSKEFCHE